MDPSLQDMNNMMLDIWKDYLELTSIFTSKLEEIRADEELNVNLELLRASITDLSINLGNFKDNLSSNTSSSNTSSTSINNNASKTNENTSVNNFLSNLEGNAKKQMLAFFFMFLMKIDKESILNKESILKGKPFDLDKLTNSKSPSYTTNLAHPHYADLD
jgi:hypothetical protein